MNVNNAEEKKNEKNITILGQKWKIIFNDKLEDNEADAETIPKEKIIKVKKLNKDVDADRILRHEIIHAFLFESGLGWNFEHHMWGHDETMIDWFAIQYPKIKKVYAQLGIE